LIVSGVHPSPVEYADFVTTTTHKTLRGPRGALIMVTERGLKEDPDLGKKLNASIIPGMQGGPHDNQTAAIAVALLEASKPSFKKYGAQIVKNCKALAKELLKYDFKLVSGGTDNHLILMDLRNRKVNGRVFAEALEQAGIVTNYNMVPYDPMPPLYASGLRTGTAAITSRGMKEKDMARVAKWFDTVAKEVEGLELPAGVEAKARRIALFKEHQKTVLQNKKLPQIAKEVKQFANKFPVTF
jgi:glycine hydroxymethyltransferase